MRSGKLRHRVIIQQPTSSIADSGAETRAYATVDTVWANVSPLSGRERFWARQVHPELSHIVRMRYTKWAHPNNRLLVPKGHSTIASATTGTTNTSITVTDPDYFPQSPDASNPGKDFRVQIDSELMIVTAGHGSTGSWTVTRGADNTTASTHASGTQITYMAPFEIESVVNLEERDIELELHCIEQVL